MVTGRPAEQDARSFFASLPPAPLPPSRLELLAWKAEVSPEVVRRWLRVEIERRRAEVTSEPATGASGREDLYPGASFRPDGLLQRR